MKIFRYYFLLLFLCSGGVTNAESVVPVLFIQMHGDDYKPLSLVNETNLRFGVGYNLNEHNFDSVKKIESTSETKDTSLFSVNESFFRNKKLFFGLNYEYHKNGRNNLSLFTKPKYTDGSYFTFTATPKELSAVISYNF